MSYIFLTPEQYNKIYSESTKILINANIDDRINVLQFENKKFIEVLKLVADSGSICSKTAEKGLKEIGEL